MIDVEQPVVQEILGALPARVLPRLGRASAMHQVAGVDSSPEMLEAVRSRSPARLLFPDERFDSVVCALTLAQAVFLECT
ncbi:methyltransferase domain-containing protein [Tenggerimyces flavus]|uniref:Methyltransferase domain-containing protein n=1 Tax=Tenggerimyces flavus TaxID=1708749 RepID=A0ABV7YE50_9ACTN|nr:class I SAM-dependent methyltransferase [Tenggerimyces flavus]MBM7784314.1 ubiquinone/menaquinone biosynthesis C-methylase UbiE [Tenggerimyces flavus]